jgi:hypothetical protein
MDFRDSHSDRRLLIGFPRRFVERVREDTPQIFSLPPVEVSADTRFGYWATILLRRLATVAYLAAGATDRLWSIEDLVALWESYEQRRGGKNGLKKVREGDRQT